MHWTAEDYLAFLTALYTGQILSGSMRTELWADQRGKAAVVESPIFGAMGEDWGYGLGNWIECSGPAFDCGTSLQRNSSPGAYGAYPFIDFEDKYYGILARQGALWDIRKRDRSFPNRRNHGKKMGYRSCGPRS